MLTRRPLPDKHPSQAGDPSLEARDTPGAEDLPGDGPLTLRARMTALVVQPSGQVVSRWVPDGGGVVGPPELDDVVWCRVALAARSSRERRRRLVRSRLTGVGPMPQGP